MTKKAKKKTGICKDCQHYTPNADYPGYKAGKCSKGFKQFGGMDERFDVREDNSCKKWKGE